MNCKPGDMAIIISGCDSGKMLTCIELAGDRPADHDDLPDDPQNRFAPTLGPVWLTDRPIQWHADHQPKGLMPYCPDAILMPIQPDEDRDLLFRTEGHIDKLEELLSKRQEHNRVLWP